MALERILSLSASSAATGHAAKRAWWGAQTLSACEVLGEADGDASGVTVFGNLAALLELDRNMRMVAWGGLEPPTPAL